MPPLTVPASQLCSGLNRMIDWASEIRDVVCCLDPKMEIKCHERERPPLMLMSTGSSQPILAVTCPPNPPTSTSGTTTAGDLCKALTLLIAWAEDLKDVTSCIPDSTKIRVPAHVVAKGKLRKEALRGMEPAKILHTVSCPPPDFQASKKRRPPVGRKRR